MKLFKKTGMDKQAGTKLPNNPKQWPTQVLKGIKNQHPYVDLSQVEVKFEILEPEEGRASGIVKISDKAVLPFTIRPDNKTGRSELDNMDVMFAGELFRHMNEFAYREVMDEVGKLEKKKNVGGGDFYNGEMTGDVSPLQQGGRSGMMAYANYGMLGGIIRNEDQLATLFGLLNRYSGINKSVQALGLSDSLKSISMSTMNEGPEPSRAGYLHLDEYRNICIKFEGDEKSNIINPLDVKRVLGTNYSAVMRHLMSQGWAIIRDVPELKSVSFKLTMDRNAPMLEHCSFSPIERGGKYALSIKGAGGVVHAVVANSQLNYDGTIDRIQSAIAEDGRIAYSMRFVGVKLPSGFPFRHPAGGSGIVAGAIGVFMDESFGEKMFTPKIKINQVINMPNEPVVLICTLMGEARTIGLVILDNISGPMPIRLNHREYVKTNIPEESFYIPSSLVWVETTGTFKADSINPPKVMQKNAYITRNGDNYSISNSAIDGEMISADDLRLKLASKGAPLDVIKDIIDMPNHHGGFVIGITGGSQTSRLQDKIITKNASLDYTEIRKYAEQAIEGINEAQVQEDPQVIDAVLSIQFVSDDTLSDLVSSLPMFDEVEDKVAKLLMAARQGEKTIDESGCERALKGIGGVRKSLKNLAIELESRNK